jgi:quercetin dioxygenase-like cupin family protein
MKNIIIVGLTALLFHSSIQAQQPVINRIELQKQNLSIHGREVVQVRVEFGQGSFFGKHRHPGEEIVYVLEGLIEYEIDGKPPVTLKAGEVLFIPYGTIHSAKNVGKGNAVELATYVVEKGNPIVEAVK